MKKNIVILGVIVNLIENAMKQQKHVVLRKHVIVLLRINILILHIDHLKQNQKIVLIAVNVGDLKNVLLENVVKAKIVAHKKNLIRQNT
jgi:hypothetical protein